MNILKYQSDLYIGAEGLGGVAGQHIGVGHDEYQKGFAAGVDEAARLMLALDIGGYGRLIATKIKEIK